MATAYLRVSLLMGIPIPHTLVQTSKIVATLYIIRKIYFSSNHTWKSIKCQMNLKSAKKKHQPLKVSVSNIIVLLENQLLYFNYFFLLPLLYNLILILRSNLSVKSTVPSELLRYLHLCRQTFSLFLLVHMLHSGSDTHKMHVEICLSSAKTDIL